MKGSGEPNSSVMDERHYGNGCNVQFEKGQNMAPHMGRRSRARQTIILIQQTESEHHASGHISAGYDWNLTVRGREQAFRIGEWLKLRNTWSMFVSPQKGARQTADEMNRSLCIIPVVREELREVNAGARNGNTRGWYRENAAPGGTVFDPDHRDFPNAESDRELRNRVFPFFQDMIASLAYRIIAVSHGTTIRFLQTVMAGKPRRTGEISA